MHVSFLCRFAVTPNYTIIGHVVNKNIATVYNLASQAKNSLPSCCTGINSLNLSKEGKCHDIISLT
jgi:hypothetical protein